jgi:phage terminase large subunit GpA-like protein
MIPLARRFLDRIAPPPRLELGPWIESNIYLPAGVSAVPGQMHLWPWQVGIAAAISDPAVTRITLVKPTRVGFTSLLTGTIASFVVNEPAPILLLLPTESDCRDYVVSELEPIFSASPALAKVLAPGRAGGGRDTLTSRHFNGGSVRVVAAKAQRNLRRLNVRILLCDEVDAMEAGNEGSPIALVEKRTTSFNNRKIVIGSTPIFSDVSHVLRSYGESDERVFEVPCPHCGAFFEILWKHIIWPPGEPERAQCQCPHCSELIGERNKSAMVHAGQWTATKSDVKGHAGFRLNALVSLLSNASWPNLVKEFLQAGNDPTQLQVFVNTVLAEGWSSPTMVDAGDVSARAEAFSLEAIPAEVISIVVGCDVQDDRIEVSFIGWDKDKTAYVLSHQIVWGGYEDTSTWQELDKALYGTWRHPHGGRLKVDACAIDCADGEHYPAVLAYAAPRYGRRIFATKGLPGNRAPFDLAKDRPLANRFAIIGTDPLKNAIFDRIQRGRGLRFSNSLQPIYYEQLASERRVVKNVRGMPKRQFLRIGKVRNEALDCLTYAFGVRESFHLDMEHASPNCEGKRSNAVRSRRNWPALAIGRRDQ